MQRGVSPLAKESRLRRGAVLPHHTCYPLKGQIPGGGILQNFPPGCWLLVCSGQPLPTVHPPSSATSLPRSVEVKHAGAIAGRDDLLPLPGKLAAASGLPLRPVWLADR
jgi:hypothetical protein